MKGIFGTLLLCLLLNFNSNAQGSSSMANGAINSGFHIYEVTEMKYTPKLTGSDYLYSDWLLADVQLRVDSGLIKNVLVKLDVNYDVAEIKLTDTVRLVPSLLIESVKFKNPERGEFTTRYAIDLLGPIGFYEVIYDKDFAIYKYYFTRVKKADYNYVLNTGSKDDIVVLKESYFMKYNDKLIPFKMHKQSFLALFDDSAPLQAFMKENKIRLKTEQDLVEVSEFLNSNKMALKIKYENAIN